MTNKQKAIEIANHRESEFGEIRDINGCCFMSALDMAEWKDNQFKTELERLMNRFVDEESHKAYFSLETLQELYSNLFQNTIEPL